MIYRRPGQRREEHCGKSTRDKETPRQAVHGGPAEEPRQGRLDLRGHARFGRVLRDSRPRQVRGTIDGRPFQSAFMAMGDGTHMLPVKAEVRRAIGKEEGDSVSVRLEERIGDR